jgi:adenine-specific DNA-methyltransferase
MSDANQNSNDKLDMQSPDLVQQNFEKLAELFPNCITESATGKAIDFDLLKQELNHAVVEGNKERYRLEWPGKREAIVTANLPTTKTLRPVREDSVDFDNTENLYVEGDNHQVLQLLQESYLNKIKMVYIDPPYNTGNDILYRNDFASSKQEHQTESGELSVSGLKMVTNTESNGRFHSDWLTMMYPKIKLAKNLLTNDGIFVITIDYYELCNLGSICDEIFGYENRLGLVTIVHNPKGRNQADFFSENSEFMLVYAKNIELASFNEVAIDEEVLETFNLQDSKGKFRYEPYIRARTSWSRKNRPNNWYPIYVSKDLKDITTVFKEGYIEIYPVTNTGDFSWKNIKSTFNELNKNEYFIAKSENGKIILYHKYYEQQVFKNVWTAKKYQSEFNGTKVIKDLFEGKNIFSFPKSVHAVKDITKMIVDKDSIILDFFSGSATTAHAVMLLNSEDNGSRKYIMAQVTEPTDENSEAYQAGYKNICEIGKERIRRAAKKIKEETGASIDYGFRVYRLDESNMQDVYYRPQDLDQAKMDLFGDNVKPDRTEDDLLAQVMLDWGLPLSLKIEQATVVGKKVFKVAENSLFACFDKGLDEAFAKEIAKEKPLRIVFKDAGFKDDTAKNNVKQLLKQLSPETEMKVL